ncbi:MAG TPA: hypothetical protein VMH26_15000 [Burkholderiales bacterium]|nr:hypothetical protein [Burkholderiales bacterium]
MKCFLYLTAAATLLVCLNPPQAQTLDSTTRRTATSDARFETLRPDSGFSDWRRLSLEGGARATDMGASYAYTLPGDPLGANAPETTGGYWRPLSQRLSSLVETSVVPGTLGGIERSVLGQLATQFGDGWGMQAGVRHSQFGVPLPESLNGRAGLGLTALPPASLGPTVGADLGTVTVERFWDRYRGAYTVSSARADGGATATSHRLQFNYFYSSQSSVGLSYTTGRSFDSAVPLYGMTPAESSNVGLVGEHWFSPSWGINYNALLEDRGVDGLKPEIRLGLRLRF